MTALTVEARDGAARTGTLSTAHGMVRTPAFMPVGTHATVKSLDPDEVRACGADILLCNAYHLALRPGVDLIERAGGLHSFMGWDGPILTDSGGFQLVSLRRVATVDEDGATFVSPYDGNRLRVTPEEAVSIQARLDSDIVMCLDQPVAWGSDSAAVAAASRRTHRWAERSAMVHPGDGRLLFGICQGGFEAEARVASARAIAALDFDGVAVGGLSVGEPLATMEAMTAASVAQLPPDRPRYFMGLGTDSELLAMVGLGIDMFDCVAPTRLARSGAAMTPDGRLSLRRAAYRDDLRPLVEGCRCPACARFSRAYLRHLFVAGEILAHRLLSLHNVTHVSALMAAARAAIRAGRLGTLRAEAEARLRNRPDGGDAVDDELAPPRAQRVGASRIPGTLGSRG
ncbi:MAG: tRNA guanosine(34) transglycosylase Tgt [Candidatus Dormibacteraeota bacterium]|uniref:Queuine tRNA-ribosyltransferase n=1 Tax=Candidatus Amunia macphersoniae TaxID=3127014 RepID=A0A934KGJ2_9BACT|nr:tRNA guanosine(34) transglycosylase Tgt [Candidatus Dormibacteraeota bacterium]